MSWSKKNSFLSVNFTVFQKNFLIIFKWFQLVESYWSKNVNLLILFPNKIFILFIFIKKNYYCLIKKFFFMIISFIFPVFFSYIKNRYMKTSKLVKPNNHSSSKFSGISRVYVFVGSITLKCKVSCDFEWVCL